MIAPTGLSGLRVLVVEDDMLIAICVEEVLQSLGCVVVGPVSKLDAAMRMANDEALDAAILDINIRGGRVYPVAERLRARYPVRAGKRLWRLGLTRSLPKPAAPDQAVHDAGT